MPPTVNTLLNVGVAVRGVGEHAGVSLFRGVTYFLVCSRVYFTSWVLATRLPLWRSSLKLFLPGGGIDTLTRPGVTPLTPTCQHLRGPVSGQ